MLKINIEKILTYLVPPSILLIPVVVGLYFWNFPNGFSNQTHDWSNFGGYIGGTLGPLFAFLAFLAGLQNLNEVRSQKKKEEILNSVKGYERNLLDAYSMVVTCESPWVWGNDIDAADDINELPLRTLLQSDSIDWEYHLKYLRDSLKFRVQPSGELFQDRDIWLKALTASEGLFKYLQQYQNAGGDESIIEYYNHTYEISRNRLIETDWGNMA